MVSVQFNGEMPAARDWDAHLRIREACPMTEEPGTSRP